MLRTTSTRRGVPLLRGLWVVGVCTLLPSFAVAQEVTIRGRVRNADGKTIKFPKVAVKDANGTVVPTEVSHEEDGFAFLVRVPSKLGKVSVLFEDRPFHHPHLVTNLSTTPGDDHTINPVLRRSSGPANYDLIVEQILIYEQILLSELGAKPSSETIRSFQERYDPLIAQLPDPQKFKDYAEDSVQHKAISKMSRDQRTLLAFKLRQLRGNIAALLRAATTSEPAPAPPVN
jgi:hypothetical protein